MQADDAGQSKVFTQNDQSSVGGEAFRPPPPHRHLTFFGNIHPTSTIPLRIALCELANEGAEEVTVLFASAGGSIDDGVALFTFLRALPFKLTFHAAGLVGSMAVPIFLAAPHRLASVNARFLLHEFHWTDPQVQRVTQSTIVERTMILDSAVTWTKDILKSTTTLTDERIKEMNMFQEPLLLNAEQALEIGMVEGIAEPRIPSESYARIVGA